MVSVRFEADSGTDTFSRFVFWAQNACYIGPAFWNDGCLSAQTASGSLDKTLLSITLNPGDTLSLQIGANTTAGEWSGTIKVDNVIVAQSNRILNAEPLVYYHPTVETKKKQSNIGIVI